MNKKLSMAFEAVRIHAPEYSGIENCRVEMTKEFETLSIDGDSILYINPDFFDSMSQSEANFAILHMAMILEYADRINACESEVIGNVTASALVCKRIMAMGNSAFDIGAERNLPSIDANDFDSGYVEMDKKYGHPLNRRPINDRHESDIQP